MDWILCLIAGALAGSLVSMTGSGAGFLLAPGLSLALNFGAFPNADLFKIAVATTHGANLITNLAAFQAHAVRRSIDWDAFIRLGPGSIAGAAAGAVLATHLDTAIFELVFIASAIALFARLLRRHRKIEPRKIEPTDEPSIAVWVTRSAAMGVWGQAAPRSIRPFVVRAIATSSKSEARSRRREPNSPANGKRSRAIRSATSPERSPARELKP